MTGPVPILRLGDILLTGLLNDLDDKTALEFTGELVDRISAEGSRGVVIDISRLEIIDSFVARVLMELAGTGKLLGARMIVAGMRPAVAITLSELGLQLSGVETALNAERAMARLGWEQRPRRAEAHAAG
ncbi:STAS domain-containing protein [Amycolatopsis magusensis]|uniref:RsbT antagonist protein RsbS n=1 Tax=Amycolatopsis magusensis TaxID=882444 RepID=A0ABS4Q025_9PSEU|nr:STAS domain-containing protein [Amycolatopsis magusensis]MBP2185026.1 rsbT antagonist protein RsbS [Amycolatopsis magusensis]MDI5977287.1 STAS domain-containing protein [Amycolatopsis magusensis]